MLKRPILCCMMCGVTIHLCKHSINPVLASIPNQLVSKQLGLHSDLMTSYHNEVCQQGIIFIGYYTVDCTIPIHIWTSACRLVQYGSHLCTSPNIFRYCTVNCIMTFLLYIQLLYMPVLNYILF